MAASEAWRQLHPASVAVNLVPTAWRVVRSLWPLLLAFFVGRGGAGIDRIELGIIGFFFIAPVWRTVWHWLTLRYRVSEGRLEIQSGVLYRQARVISPERIQNVELVRNVFHRMSGLVEVKVETASGTDIEGQLSALSEAEAHELMEALDAARQRVRPDPTAEEQAVALVENDFFDLVKYGLSTARLGLALVAMGVLYEAVISLDPNRGAEVAALNLGTAGTAAIVVVLVLGAWIAGATTSILRHWGFRLVRTAQTLVAEEGLFTRRRVELSERKIQLVTLSQSFIRRTLGFGVLHLETAAAREGAGGTQTAEAVVPVLPEDRFQDVLRAALPDVPELGSLTMKPPHPRAVLRALINSGVRTSLGAGFIAWLFFPVGTLALAFVPMALFATWFDHLHQGWWVGDRHIVSRTGWWVRRTRIVARDKLQSLQLVQGPLARRWDLARLRIRVAGSSVALPVLSFGDALELELALSEALPSVVARSEERSRVPVLLDDHEERPRHEGPRDGLGDATGEQEQRIHEHPHPERTIPGVADAPGEDEEAERDRDAGGDQDRQGERGDLAVEPGFPQEVHAGLEQHHDPLEGHEHPESDVHTGDDDSHER